MAMRSTALRRGLREHHVNMIAFSACIGVGLFLQSGRVVYLAGPGLAVIAYILMGTVMASAMACLGEMTALFPVQGPLFEFPRRFLDEGIGYAVGWLAWFSWTVIIAAEILAITQIWKFQFSEQYLRDVGYPDNYLGWKWGQDTSPAVWVFVFLIIVGAVNILPVRQYGQLEFIFGSIKMAFICLLILFNVIVNAKKIVYHNGNSRFWTYNDPYSFAAQNFTLSAGPDGHNEVIPDGAGRLAGMWSAMTTTIWSMIGFETVAITAAENEDLERDETVKIATRKIALRIILLYSLSVFVVGLNVPYTDPNLRDLTVNSIRSGQNSIFILAAVRNHTRDWPHFFNGFFIFSATTSGINSLYNSSRLLHALASIDDAWPDWRIARSLQRRLRRTTRGVPLVSVFGSWLFGLLAFLSSKPFPSEILGRIATNSAVSMLIVYIAVCASYLQFYKIIGLASGGNGPNGPEDVIEMRYRGAYNRDGPRFPYRAHLQWARACYGLFGCSLMALFNGWRTFVSPFSPADFVAAYISIAVFLVLVVAYHIRSDGYDPRLWRRNADKEIKQPEPVVTLEEDPTHRRGRLYLPDEDDLFTRRNFGNFVKWMWVWMR